MSINELEKLVNKLKIESEELFNKLGDFAEDEKLINEYINKNQAYLKYKKELEELKNR